MSNSNSNTQDTPYGVGCREREECEVGVSVKVCTSQIKWWKIFLAINILEIAKYF